MRKKLICSLTILTPFLFFCCGVFAFSGLRVELWDILQGRRQEHLGGDQLPGGMEYPSGDGGSGNPFLESLL